MKLSKLVFAMIAGATATASFANQSISQRSGQMAGQSTGQSTSQHMPSYSQSTKQTAGQTIGQTAGQSVSQTANQRMPSASQSIAQSHDSNITAGNIVNNGGYVQDSQGFIVRNSSGLCVRTGYWTPELAQPECEGGLPAPVVEPTPVVVPAPIIVEAPIVVEAPPVVEPVAMPVEAPKPVELPKPVVTLEKITFAADAFFDKDKSILKSEAKVKLNDLAYKVKGIALEVIVAVGHTDSDASDAYNDKLSMRRAIAVKNYLISKGIESNRVLTEGKGERQPAASNATKAGKARNRRVEIEVVGTRSVNK